MSEKIYSVELQENEWADDTYTGEFEDCVEFCNENYYKIDGVDARIAEIQYDEDGSSKRINTVCNVNYNARKGWSYDDDFWDMPDITHAEFVDFEIDWKRAIAEDYDEIMEYISDKPEDHEITLSYYFSPEYDACFESDSPMTCDTITVEEIFDIIKQKDFELLKREAEEKAKLEAEEFAKWEAKWKAEHAARWEAEERERAARWVALMKKSL